MTLYITAAPNFNQDTFDRAIERIQDGRRELVVDLCRCIFVDAYVLVSLITVITLASAEAGYTVTLRLPVRQSARTYFARMHFFDLLPGNVVTDGPLPAVTERGAYLMPLTRLNVHGGEQAVEDLANCVWPQLPWQLAERFTGALAEIASNVIPGVTAKPGVHSGVGLSTVRDYARYFGGVMRLPSGGLLWYSGHRGRKRSGAQSARTVISVELSSPGRRRLRWLLREDRCPS